MEEKTIEVPTKAGSVDTFICHPERRGPWPAIIIFMDAPGIREELYDMVRRLATVGYYTVLPNLFYRHGHGTTCGPQANIPGTEDQKRMFELMGSLTNSMVAEDTEDMLAFLSSQSEVKRGAMGCVGYCMSGPFAVTAAARFPERFAAAASLHGVALVSDKPDSVHRALERIKAELYFGFGDADVLTPREEIETLRKALEKTPVRFEIEMYAQCAHGFVFPQRQHYRKAAAERHWERIIDLFRRNLPG